MAKVRIPKKNRSVSNTHKSCSACGGSGYYDHNGSPPCGSCNGKGK